MDKTKEYPFMVCYCDYHNPLSAAWPTEAIGMDDYLKAMQIFTDRVKLQIDRIKKQDKFLFDKTPSTDKDYIPDKRSESIVGKVVAINTMSMRYEYQHAASQFVLVDGGNGALGRIGQAVFGTCLSDGHSARWERFDVLGEIRPDRMPDWVKDALKRLG